eukprot:scaffold15394_cov111-Isochrysis_galbana.AAC.2
MWKIFELLLAACLLPLRFSCRNSASRLRRLSRRRNCNCSRHCSRCGHRPTGRHPPCRPAACHSPTPRPTLRRLGGGGPGAPRRAAQRPS